VHRSCNLAVKELPAVRTDVKIDGLSLVNGYKCSACQLPFKSKSGIINHLKSCDPTGSIHNSQLYQSGKREYILYDGAPIGATSSNQKNTKDLLMKRFKDINQCNVESDDRNNYFDQITGWTRFYRNVGLEKAVDLVSLNENDLISKQEIDQIVKNTFEYLKKINESLSMSFINIRSFKLHLPAVYW
jgi:hypothetical protein